MTWDQVGVNAPKGGDGAPVLKIEAGKPVRIRLISDGQEGSKYNGPAKRFQHWPDDNTIKTPIACIGPRNGCIFHQAPIAWRVSCQFVMNVIVYKIEAGKVISKEILAYPAGSSVFGGIKDHADLIGIDPMATDWIIARTGTGKNDTKYTVAPAPGAPLDGERVDLSQFPTQDKYADPTVPQLIDFDEFDSFKQRTPTEQEAWLERALGTESQPALKAPAAQLVGQAQAIDVSYRVVTGAETPPPKPAKISLNAAPPPKPTIQRADPRAMKDPWNEKSMGELDTDTLTYITKEPGFSVEHVAAAQHILSGGTATTTAAPTQDDAAARAELTQFCKTLQSINTFENARKFFMLGGANSIQRMSNEGVQKLLALARQGDAAVTAAIATVTPNA